MSVISSCKTRRGKKKKKRTHLSQWIISMWDGLSWWTTWRFFRKTGCKQSGRGSAHHCRLLANRLHLNCNMLKWWCPHSWSRGIFFHNGFNSENSLKVWISFVVVTVLLEKVLLYITTCFLHNLVIRKENPLLCNPFYKAIFHINNLSTCTTACSFHMQQM